MGEDQELLEYVSRKLDVLRDYGVVQPNKTVRIQFTFDVGSKKWFFRHCVKVDRGYSPWSRVRELDFHGVRKIFVQFPRMLITKDMTREFYSHSLKLLAEEAAELRSFWTAKIKTAKDKLRKGGGAANAQARREAKAEAQRQADAARPSHEAANAQAQREVKAAWVRASCAKAEADAEAQREVRAAWVRAASAKAEADAEAQREVKAAWARAASAKAEADAEVQREVKALREVEPDLTEARQQLEHFQSQLAQLEADVKTAKASFAADKAERKSQQWVEGFCEHENRIKIMPMKHGRMH